MKACSRKTLAGLTAGRFWSQGRCLFQLLCSRQAAAKKKPATSRRQRLARAQGSDRLVPGFTLRVEKSPKTASQNNIAE